MNLLTDSEEEDDTETSQQIEQWTALMFACYNGHSAIVDRLVRVPGIWIMYRDTDDDLYSKGQTAPSVAYNDVDCVRILAETGKVNWNIFSILYGSPLNAAIRCGRTDCLGKGSINYRL